MSAPGRGDGWPNRRLVTSGSGGHGDTIFPLPRVPLSVFGEVDGARRQRRLGRLANDAVNALNWLHGAAHREPGSLSSTSLLRQSGLQAEVQHRVVRSSLEFPDLVCAPVGWEALNELLKGRTSYAGGGSSATVAPFEYSRVSVPNSVANAPLVVDLLPAEDAETLRGYEGRMLRPAAEQAALEQ